MSLPFLDMLILTETSIWKCKIWPVKRTPVETDAVSNHILTATCQ